MPIKDIISGGYEEGAAASIDIGKIVCAVRPYGFYKNCEAARKSGWTTGEVQLFPHSSVQPFTAYCDMDMVPSAGRSRMHNKIN